MILAAAAAIARAQAPCALAPAEVEEAAARSAAAIAEDDAGAHGAILEDLLGRMACLREPLPSRPWARLLLDEAIVRFAAGAPHADLVATALRADPALEVPAFLLAGAPAPTVVPLADLLAAEVLVDGVAVPTAVDLRGLHVVQARDASGSAPRQWVTVVRLDEALPADWVARAGPEPPLRRGGAWVALGAGAAWADRAQRVQRPDARLGDAHATGPVGRVAASADLRAGALGLVADASCTFGADVVPAVLGGPAIAAGPAAVWIGGGLVAVPLAEGDDVRLALLPQPAAGLHLVADGLDAGASAGWTPGVANGAVRWGLRLAELGGAGLRLGAELGAVGARFVETPGGREVNVLRLHGGLDLGIAGGR